MNDAADAIDIGDSEKAGDFSIKKESGKRRKRKNNN
jgi:hypothetical protein